MLIGDHPPQGSVHTLHCPFSWLFACDYKAPGAKERCGRQRSFRCDGGPHILLDEAIRALRQLGWRLDPHGAGWLCSEHRDALLEPPPRYKKKRAKKEGGARPAGATPRPEERAP